MRWVTQLRREVQIYMKDIPGQHGLMAANMNNLYGDGNGYVGNVDLKPETAHTFSVSSDWHDKTKKNWSFKATPYFTYVADYIDAVACSTRLENHVCPEVMGFQR